MIGRTSCKETLTVLECVTDGAGDEYALIAGLLIAGSAGILTFWIASSWCAAACGKRTRRVLCEIGAIAGAQIGIRRYASCTGKLIGRYTPAILKSVAGNTGILAFRSASGGRATVCGKRTRRVLCEIGAIAGAQIGIRGDRPRALHCAVP